MLYGIIDTVYTFVELQQGPVIDKFSGVEMYVKYYFDSKSYLWKNFIAFDGFYV